MLINLFNVLKPIYKGRTWRAGFFAPTLFSLLLGFERYLCKILLSLSQLFLMFLPSWMQTAANTTKTGMQYAHSRMGWKRPAL